MAAGRFIIFVSLAQRGPTRARELAATGADVAGAACPVCNTMLGDALAAVSTTPPKFAGHRPDRRGVPALTKPMQQRSHLPFALPFALDKPT